MNNNAPINGMPHLAHLGRKEGDLPSETSLRGWYLIRIAIHTNGVHILFGCVENKPALLRT